MGSHDLADSTITRTFKSERVSECYGFLVVTFILVALQ